MPTNEIPIEDRRDSVASSLSSVASRGLHLINEFEPSDSADSSLRSDPEVDDRLYRVQYPPQPYYLPVVIPTEPTLDELLRRVTGREDLENVEMLKIRVISYMVSLCRLSAFTPILNSLDLDGSVLSSLRDLGCSLTHLKYLNVSNCGLTSLDGTNGVSTVEVLIADGNRIEIVNPLCNLTLLKRVSLKDNLIRHVESVGFFGLCPMLNEINLEGNPVTKHAFYRHEIRKNVENIELLDGKTFDDQFEGEESRKTESKTASTSSLSEGSFERECSTESDDNQHRLSIRQRPSTSHGICHVTIKEEPQRPDSAGVGTVRRMLTSGDPLCGSIVSTARQQKRQQIRSSAWGDSTSSSASSNSLDYSFDKNFPSQLPQTHVELELGIVGTRGNSNSDSDSNCSLKENALKWRSGKN